MWCVCVGNFISEGCSPGVLVPTMSERASLLIDNLARAGAEEHPKPSGSLGSKLSGMIHFKK
jgi:hypothetical protein